MNDHNDPRNMDPWDRDSYGTGSTRPPKNRGGILAAVLIAVILISGITSAMGHFRVPAPAVPTDPSDMLQLFPSSADTSITDPTRDQSVTAPSKGKFTVELNKQPEPVENIPQAGGLSLQEIYARNIDSVVSITCTHADGSSSGTGVVLSRDGYLVTNSHVVVNAQSVSVLLTDGRTFPAAVVGTDAVTDLAVLYIDAKDLSPAEFGDSAQMRVGDAVVAIGDPLGIELRGTMTDGIVSAINRDIVQDGWTMSLLQTNAALNSGNSGGPLINCYGQVIGINAMKIGAFADSAGVEGLGFAIPSATVKEVVDQLIAQGYVSGRPRMGLEVQAISEYYQKFYNLPAGIRIVSVMADGPAAGIGIQPGDILLAIDDTRTTSLDELNAALYAHQAGDTVTLTMYRSGKQYTAKLTLGQTGA